MTSKIFKESRARVSDSSKIFVKNSFEIINRIHELMKNEGGLTQKELAKKLGKSESEISKILSPGHNLTLKTISKIEAAFNESILFPERNKVVFPRVVYPKLSSPNRASRINKVLMSKRRKDISAA